MRDDFGGEINLGRQDDDFGESCSLYEDSDLASSIRSNSHLPQGELARRSSRMHSGADHARWFEQDDVSMLNLHEATDSDTGMDMLNSRKRSRGVFPGLSL